jgi:hypothetical protein
MFKPLSDKTVSYLNDLGRFLIDIAKVVLTVAVITPLFTVGIPLFTIMEATSMSDIELDVAMLIGAIVGAGTVCVGIFLKNLTKQI